MTTIDNHMLIVLAASLAWELSKTPSGDLKFEKIMYTIESSEIDYALACEWYNEEDAVKKDHILLDLLTRP